MAASGYTPISLYYSTTAAAVPVNTNLVNGELAINITDGKLYYKDNTGTVKLLASNSASTPVTSISFGSTGLTPNTSTTGAVTVAGTLAATSGGTGQSSFTTGDLLYASSSSALSKLSATTNGYVLTLAAGVPSWAAPSTGTVTAVSVTSANGFAGTSSGGATPALTLSTTVTGVIKGNGTAISAATAGTDYAKPDTASTWTALQTFAGTSSNAALKTDNIKEVATVSATAATGTINYDITTQSVLYYTTNASANWTVNFRGSSGTSLDTIMSTGESLSVTFLVTQGATAYYNSSVQVDGTTSGVTTKWQGGSAPTSGNASSIDSYTYVIIKTGSATFTVLATQTKFA